METSKKHLGLLFSAIVRKNSYKERYKVLPKVTLILFFQKSTFPSFPSYLNFLNSQTRLSHWLIASSHVIKLTKTLTVPYSWQQNGGCLRRRKCNLPWFQMSNKVKTGLFIAGFTAFTLAALYPVVVYPKLHPEVYSMYNIYTDGYFANFLIS